VNLLDALRGLIRRWYVVVPGILIAAVASFFVWTDTPPDYERSTSLLLLPGEGVLPEGATNQYLYMGGLGPVADVLTRAVGGEEMVQAYRTEGAEVEIVRDGSGSGPLMFLTVTASSDQAAQRILEAVAEQTAVTLDELQAEQGVRPVDRVTVSTIAMVQESEILQRPRLIATGTVGLGISLVTLVVASVLDGMLTRRRRPRRDAEQAGEEPDVLDDAVSDGDGGVSDRPVTGTHSADTEEWEPLWADTDREDTMPGRPRSGGVDTRAGHERELVRRPSGGGDDL